MDQAPSDPLPPLRHAERQVCLETDIFCYECGYNLHSQPVTRDERLGIFICRCPECGRFHPAGIGFTATRPWLNRLAIGLLVLWVLIVLFAMFWAVIAMGAVMVLHVESLSYRNMVATDGSEVEWADLNVGNRRGPQVVRKGTTQPVNQWTWQYTSQRPADVNGPYAYYNNRRTAQQEWEMRLVILGMAAAIGLSSGLLLVVFLWHWQRRRFLWMLLLPLAVAAAVCSILAWNAEYRLILRWAIGVSFGYALLEAAFMLLGIKIGRPIARGILRMVVPPRPRQHFAFLWTADGIKPPPATTG